MTTTAGAVEGGSGGAVGHRGAQAAGAAGRARPERGGLGGDFWKLWTAATVSKVGDGVVLIAIPWLTTTLTTSALVVALMGVAIRLPWLLFSLPAGVWADRLDRRKLMLAVNAVRVVLAGGLALLVHTDALTLPVLFAFALALGCCEVVFDNTSQVLLPSVVERKRLEAANGRLMGAQMVLGEFIGRPLTGVLIGIAMTLPFLFDAAAALVSVLVLCTVRGSFRGGRAAAVTAAAGEVPSRRRSMRAEVAEGMRWMWSHPLLRPLAIALAWSNAVHAGAFAIYVLYAQEILGLGPQAFALLTATGAFGGFLGSFVAARISRRIGPGTSLLVTVGASTLSTGVIALASDVWLVAVVGVLSGAGVVLWNVVTVTLRQSIIPDDLLGRVNSCFRLLGWGCMPLGMAVGGGVVTVVEHFWGREAGLRAPFALAALLLAGGLFWYVRARLTGQAIRAALDGAAGPDGAADGAADGTADGTPADVR